MIETDDLQRSERRVRVVESKLEKVEADLAIANGRLARIDMALESARERLGLGSWPEGLDRDERIDWIVDEIEDEWDAQDD